jgi:hypothetical protein
MKVLPCDDLFPLFRNLTYRQLAIARLLNENMAALAKALPGRFKFFATTPFPYVRAS